MAIKGYLMIDGLPGYSTSKKDAIDILSMRFGATYAAPRLTNNGKEAPGRADLQDITITKLMDGTSPLLFGDCLKPRQLTVDITYEKPMGDDQEEFAKIHLEQAAIVSIEFSSSIENVITESVTFAYGLIKVSYSPEVNGMLGGFIDKGWNLFSGDYW